MFLTTLLTVSSLALGGVAVKVEPTSLVAGSNARATLELLALDAAGVPLPAGALKLTATVGTLSPLQPAGPGRFRATFTPPKEKYAQVAVLSVSVATGATVERTWRTLVLEGAETLELSAPPGAQVQVKVEGRTFGPVKADRKGQARVPIRIPPGTRQAQVEIASKKGAPQKVTVDLPTGRYPLVALSVGREAVSWSDGPVELEAFAIDPAGRPAMPDTLTLSSPRGAFEAVRYKGDGVFSVRYTAPTGVGNGVVTLAAQITDGPPDLSLEVPLRAGPPARLELTTTPSRISAGSDGKVVAKLKAVDAHGNAAPLTRRPELEVELASVSWAANDTAELVFPQARGGKTRAVLRARAGTASAEATVPLDSGPLAKGELRDVPPTAHAGEWVEAELTGQDSHGNPLTTADGLAAAAPAGAKLDLSVIQPGELRLRWRVPKDQPAGETELAVRAERTGFTARSRLSVLPYRGGWGLSGGLYALAQTNLARARAGGTALELGVRPDRGPLELIAQLGGNLYGRFEQQITDDASIQGSMTALTLTIGARYSYRLMGQLAAHGGAMVGTQRTWTWLTAQIAGQPPLEPQRRVQSNLLARFAAGLNYPVGPGRLLGELRTDLSFATGAVSGNLGGFVLVAGYAYDLR